MKTMKIWSLSLAITASACLMPEVCSAKGGVSTRGGGDVFSQDFAINGWSTYRELSSNYPADVPRIDLALYKQALDTVLVISTDDPLALDGAPKDAINDLEKRTITISRSRWSSLSSSQKRRLALHEYLRFMEVDDANYRVSSPVAIAVEGRPVAKMAAWLSGVHLRSSTLLASLGAESRIDGIFRKGLTARACYEAASIVEQLSWVSRLYLGSDLSSTREVPSMDEVSRLGIWSVGTRDSCITGHISGTTGRVFEASEHNLKILLTLIVRDSEIALSRLSKFQGGTGEDEVVIWDRHAKKLSSLGRMN